MTDQECNGIFLSHASEDKEKIVEPLIECLKSGGISNIWYDKNEVEEGHSIIRKINEGLSNSKIGIIVLTPNFIGKHFTNWELECLLWLMIYNKIRLIPLMKNINREQIVEKYPLMNPLLFKEILDDCDEELIQHINNYLLKGNFLINHPNNQVIIDEYKSNKSNGYFIDNVKSIPNELNPLISDIDKETLAKIYIEIQKNSPLIKEINITKILTFASKRRIWVHKESWDIIKYLLFSENKEDLKNGLYILGEMVKLAKLEKVFFVLRNVEELFLYKLIDFSDPKNKKSISHDALDVLEVILDSDVFFHICILVLLQSMEDITNNEDYSNYIQFFFRKIEIYKSKEKIGLLISRLEKLIETTSNDYTKSRAKNFAETIIQDYQHLL